jgi:hypothetical protein
MTAGLFVFLAFVVIVICGVSLYRDALHGRGIFR